MIRPIVQSITFNASAQELFSLFTDSKKHSAATGAKALVSTKAGAKWTAFNGMLRGRNLEVVRGKSIVQAWPATHWPKADADSILLLYFSETPRGGKVDPVHVGVPEHDHKGVTTGWPDFYWKPWRAYLKRVSRNRKA